MKRPYLVVLSIMFLSQFVMSQQSHDRIPKIILDSLDRKYSGWHLADNLSLLNLPDVSSFNYDTTKSHLNLVWGDFDGDHRTDYALYVQRRLPSGKLEERLLAFLARGLHYDEHILKEVVEPAYFGNYIWLAKKGSKHADFDEDKYFVLKHDGIEVIIIGKYSEILLYETDHFKVVTTSD